MQDEDRNCSGESHVLSKNTAFSLAAMLSRKVLLVLSSVAKQKPGTGEDNGT